MGDVGDERLTTVEERITNLSRNRLRTVIPARTQLSALERATRAKLKRRPVVSRLVISRVSRAKITDTIRILYRHLQAHVHRRATLKRDRTLTLSQMTEMK